MICTILQILKKVVQASCYYIVDLLKFLFKLCIISSSILLEFRILYEKFGKGFKKKPSLKNCEISFQARIFQFINIFWVDGVVRNGLFEVLVPRSETKRNRPFWFDTKLKLSQRRTCNCVNLREINANV